MKRKPYKMDDSSFDAVNDSATAYAYTNDVVEEKQNIRFESSVESNIVPDGYMTIEQFRKEAKTSLTKILNEHGIH